MLRFATRLALLCPFLLLLVSVLASPGQQALAQFDTAACTPDPGTEVFDWTGVPTTFFGAFFPPNADPKTFDACLKHAPSAMIYLGRQGSDDTGAFFQWFLFRDSTQASPVLCYSYSGFPDDETLRAHRQPGSVLVSMRVDSFTTRNVIAIEYIIAATNGPTITALFSGFSPTLTVTEPPAFPTDAVLATAGNRAFFVESNPGANQVQGIITGLAVNPSSPCAPPIVTHTLTPTPTSTSTHTPTVTPTSTQSPTATLTPTGTLPTATLTSTFTPTPSSTPTATVTGTLPTATPTLTATPTIAPDAFPSAFQGGGSSDDDQDDDESGSSEGEGRSGRGNSQSGRDDVATEGNVVETQCDASWPSVVIANRDGQVVLRLIKDAQLACRSIQVGDYLEVDGDKQHELLYDVTDVTIVRNGRRVR